MITSPALDIKVTTLPHTKEQIHSIPLVQSIPATRYPSTPTPASLPRLLPSSLRLASGFSQPHNLQTSKQRSGPLTDPRHSSVPSSAIPQPAQGFQAPLTSDAHAHGVLPLHNAGKRFTLSNLHSSMPCPVPSITSQKHLAALVSVTFSPYLQSLWGPVPFDSKDHNREKNRFARYECRSALGMGVGREQ